MSHPNERQKQTETPRTDAFMLTEHVAYDGMWIVFARQLETELRQAREQIESLKEHNLQLYDTMVERGKQVERLKWDVAKAVWEDNGMMRYWPSMYGKLKELGITFNILNRKPKAAMAKQPVNSSPEREPVANREQAEGGAE